MKKKNILCLSLLLTMLLTGCRTKTVVGPKGDKGDTGEPGLNGKDGKDGVNGKDGSKIYTGEGVPNDDTGVEGDLYIDTNTWDIYVKGTSTWSYSGNIKGDKGETGSAGQNGSNGENGQNGNDGKSAYQTWLDAGNTGSETDFLNWLKGSDGSNGTNGVSVVNTYIDENGNLICELSNGQTINAGKVKDVSEATKYKVNFYFKETVIDTKEVVSGSKITPPDSSLIPEGYAVTGWYINEYGMKSPWTFNGCVATSNLDLYANYSLNEYSITYNLNGGSLSNQVTSYTIEDEVTLGTPTKEGYTFLGWTGSNGETPVLNYTQPLGSLGDKNYTANWSADKQVLTVTSNDETLGTVSIVSGTGYSGESITVQATIIDDNFFKGWYANNILVSNEATYTFNMPTNSYSLVGKFFNCKYEMVTSISEIQDGDEIVFTSSSQSLDNSGYFAMSTKQNANNRGFITIDIDNGVFYYSSYSSGLARFTVHKEIVDNLVYYSFFDATKNGYLYSAGGGNYLRTKETLDDNGRWTLDIESSGSAQITSKGNSSTPYLRFNPAASLFSCYSSSSNNVSNPILYKASF